MDQFGKLLMLFAVVLFAVGAVVFVLGKAGGGFLPGDIVIRRGNWSLFFPIVTSIVVSIVLTVIINLVIRR